MQTLENMIQREDKSLIDYKYCYKSSRDVHKTHIEGLLAFKKVLEAMPDYKDVTKQDKCIQTMYEEDITFLYMNGSNHSEYGTLINGLKSQFALGSNQYPKTLNDA